METAEAEARGDLRSVEVLDAEGEGGEAVDAVEGAEFEAEEEAAEEAEEVKSGAAAFVAGQKSGGGGEEEDGAKRAFNASEAAVSAWILA